MLNSVPDTFYNDLNL